MIRPPAKTPLDFSSAFTLVETLVAITILIVTIVGPLYAVHKSLAASYVARDKLIATSLAQEGVEYVRSIRDNNYLENYTTHDGVTWLNGLSNCYAPNRCAVDQGQQSITLCPSGGCAPLRLSPSPVNLYTQNTNSAYATTRFTRSFQIANVSANEVTVTVTVSWTTLSVTYNVTVTEHLYNWL